MAIETIHFGDNSIEDYRETHYTHKDHLGSLDVITDSTGAIIQEQSFDAWGQRRNAINWAIFILTELTTFDHTLTTRGFTGHEMLDEVGVVHMNGRIYDQKLGRFLQADPIIQDPMNTQSLNRYSYAWNNPLNATDPSGYFVSLIVGVILAIKGGVDLAVAIAWMTAAAVTDTLIAGGSFKDALLAGISAVAFASIPLGEFGIGWGTVRDVVAMGFVGGVITVLQGGRFGNGFRPAGIGAVLGGATSARSSFGRSLSKGQKAVAGIIAGGTASVVSGGKFVNGVATAAFASIIRACSESITC